MSGAATPDRPNTVVGQDIDPTTFLIRGLMSGLATATLVLVRAVQAGGVGGTSTVSVQPMVAQQDGAGSIVPHGVINSIPVFRPQAGGSAVILDPVVGDIGLCVFASRDISAVKATRAPAPPASRRQFDWADGLYLGGFLNGAPSQYVEFHAGGIRLVSPVGVQIQAPMTTVTGDVVVSGDVTIGGLSFATHEHGGVEPGGGATSGPQAP